MHVREATTADAEAVRTVHHESITGLGPAAYSDEQVEAWARGVEDADYEAAITDDDAHFVVAERDGEDNGPDDEGRDDHGDDAPAIVAFGSLSLSAPEDYEADVDAEVTGVYVHSGVARQGVGTAVLSDLERRARAEGVGALGLSASLNAVAFYEDRGYERVRAYDHEFSAALSTGVEGTVVEMRTDL